MKNRIKGRDVALGLPALVQQKSAEFEHRQAAVFCPAKAEPFSQNVVHACLQIVVQVKRGGWLMV